MSRTSATGVKPPKTSVTARSFYISALCALALAVCLQLFFFSRGFYSIGWDESGRTLDAYQWAEHRTVLVSAWLPFYRICVGLALKVFPDLFLTPRVISFFCGLGAIGATAWLAHELFQCRKTTVLTIALCTFFSQRVALSLAPLSCIMFVFMILVTMAFFVRWLRTHDKSALFWGGLFGALASTVRYEGWVFCATIFLTAGIYGRFVPTGMERRDWLRLALILFSFPLAWAVSTFVITNPIRVVMADAQQYSRDAILMRNPLFQFTVTNAFSLNLIGLISLIQFSLRGSWRNKAIITVFFVPLVLVSLLLLLLQSAQTGPSWRMIAVWSMLLVPFTARVLTGYIWPFTSGPVSRTLALAATALVLGAFMRDTFRIERDSSWAFPEFDRQAGSYLDSMIAGARDTKILIESSQYFFLNIEVASQHPDAFVKNSVPWEKNALVLPIGSSVRDSVANRGVALLMFQGDAYKNFLSQSPDVTRLKDFGPWSIYKLMR